jgi:signal transduction histidine kinase
MPKLINPSKIRFAFHTVQSLRERLEWYINIRWIALFGILASVPIGQDMFNFHLAYTNIILIAALLVIINIVSTFTLRFIDYQSQYQEMIFAEIQIVIDLIIISYIIHYAGGIDNPFFFLYILQVIFSGILFPGAGLRFLNAFIACTLLTIWTVLEYNGVVNQFLLTEEPITLQIMLTSLAAFYVTIFACVFIIHSFMKRYRNLKNIIDDKNLQLEKAMRERNKLFQFTAHEIKSPVTTIKTSLSVLRSLYGKNLNTEATQLLLRAERRSDQVLDMVKKMIEITHYHLSRETLQLETVDFQEWLYKTVSPHQSIATSKHISLSLAKVENDIQIAIDTSALEKVVDNLVSNALRYTNEGGSVEVVPFVDNKTFGFSVKDTGIGISEEEQKEIFKEFYRTTKAKEMEKIGTGLGLNLVKEIVRKCGGKIEVKSKVDQGSVFKVTLPLNN